MRCTAIVRFLLLSSSLLSQGCVLVAWLGAVTVDLTRRSDVEFESFENCWVAPLTEEERMAVRYIAVAPFADNLSMAEWWAHALYSTTNRKSVGPTEMTNRLSPERMAQLTESTTENAHSVFAKEASDDLGVDAILFGRVESAAAEKAYWGAKERRQHRLYLNLINRQGAVLWRGELPFTLTKGSKEIDDGQAQRVLASHVITHEKELRWTELGFAN